MPRVPHARDGVGVGAGRCCLNSPPPLLVPTCKGTLGETGKEKLPRSRCNAKTASISIATAVMDFLKWIEAVSAHILIPAVVPGVEPRFWLYANYHRVCRVLEKTVVIAPVKKAASGLEWLPE